MNKKWISVIIVLVIAVAGIGFFWFQSQPQEILETPTIKEPITSHQNQEEKVAIVYFSATGNTKQVAEYIQEATQGTLIEIVPEEPYSDDDLNYSNDQSRTSLEQNDETSRPGIANSIDVSSYDTIYLGFPIWWDDVPKIILTFLDECDLSGKTVIPFCTSGGSSISSSENTLKSYQSEAHWQEGAKLSTSKDDVLEWINE